MGDVRRADDLAKSRIKTGFGIHRQFTLSYLLGEIALIAMALAASRLFVSSIPIAVELQAISFCIAMTAGCGALGGLCLRMAVGLIVGGVFSVVSIPLLWMLMTNRIVLEGQL
jgi:hypothetical protein